MEYHQFQRIYVLIKRVWLLAKLQKLQPKTVHPVLLQQVIALHYIFVVVS